jgi:hypothetical protein
MKTKHTRRNLKQFILIVLVIINVNALLMVEVNAQTVPYPQDVATSYLGNIMTNILIYPLPTHDFVTMKGEVVTQSNVDMTVRDILGKILYERNEMVQPGLYQRQFDLTNYPIGMYILEIRSGDQVVTTRLIRE